ncbi:hypothetical protein [Hymenobacter cellulosilyticus]|uniref:Lipoprotein n=1 Tax=Hymenobacter cellulosilyticus TaxID=2932248 RepID=A0A8T9Q5Y1_9BACT|nr:hypothetical protein [Hymenobacter cellulosilyticus]UOQ71388.1 hypothetical protein MUN79_22615 [Hymenobacter cellulosilyticus]
MSFLFRPAIWGTVLSLSVLAACSSKKNNDQAATAPEKPLTVAADTAPAPPPAPDSAASGATAPTDSTGLSPEFVKALRDVTGKQEYQVKGKTLVMEGFGTADFPTDLPAGKPVTYSGRQGAQTVTLTVTRLNYTSIRFAAEVLGGKSGPLHEEGVATLNPGFLLAAEVPEDTESQVSYGATEYLGETPTRNFSILVGLGSDADKAELSLFDATGKPLAQWQGVPTLRRLAL